MSSLRRSLVLFLLFLGASPLLHSHLLTHAASTSPPVTHRQIKFITVPDSDEEDEIDIFENHSFPPIVRNTMKTTFQQGGLKPCPNNQCLENQEPCSKVSEKTGCLCPGISGNDEPPRAPRINGLHQVTEGADRGKIQIQWCAPFSVVSKYRVVIQGSKGDALEFKEFSRRGLIGSLEVGTKVCVEAVNEAGHSTASEFSCKRYEVPESSDHKLLAGIIGGGVGFLVLLIIAAVIIWKYQMSKKAKRDSTDGLGNPSYSTEGTL